MKKYIDQLSADGTLPKGEQKRQQLNKMQKMDMIPSYIVIFDKYDNCRRFTENSCGKSKMEIYGYYAISYLCYDMAIRRHE